MVYRFGVFEFDAHTNELRKNGRVAAIEPQPAKALALLLGRPGDVVSREELRDAVWGKDTHVDFDRGLAYCISQVRSALGDSGDNPRFVQTIPKRGFKFIAPVTGDAGPPSRPEGAPAVSRRSSPESSRAEADERGRDFRRPASWQIGLGVAGFVLFGVLAFSRVFLGGPDPNEVVIAVSIFDNETGNPAYERTILGLSDLVVERLTKLDPRLRVVGNAEILRRPRNIRNLKAVADAIDADYVLLGQLQQGESGLRFITHFIRLSDEAHLRANRLPIADANLAGLEQAVVEEFERATREHVLNHGAN